MTDPLGQSQVLPYIINLSKENYKFHLISFEKPDRYSKYNSSIEKICFENKIEWYPLKYNKKPPFFSTIFDFFKMRKLTKELNVKHNFSIIHCRSYISSLVGLSFKRQYGIPFLFDMRGFWADERVEGGLWNLKNPIYKLVYKYFKIKEKIPNSKFYFLTKDNPDIIFNHCDKLGIDKNNILIEESDRGDIPYKTRNWNFSLFFIRPSYSKLFSSPTKQGELMAMGIPIICNSGVGDVDSILHKYSSGIIVEIDEKFNVESLLNNVFDEEEIVKGASEYFSLEKGIKLYKSIYDKIC